MVLPHVIRLLLYSALATDAQGNHLCVDVRNLQRGKLRQRQLAPEPDLPEEQQRRRQPMQRRQASVGGREVIRHARASARSRPVPRVPFPVNFFWERDRKRPPRLVVLNRRNQV